jgi:hypothetical protein
MCDTERASDSSVYCLDGDVLTLDVLQRGSVTALPRDFASAYLGVDWL